MDEFTLGSEGPQYFSEEADVADAMEEKISSTDRDTVRRAVDQAAKKQEREDVTYKDTEQQTAHQILCMKLARFGTSPRWSSYLRGQGFDQLQSMSKLRKMEIDELEELLTRCTCACMNRGHDDFFVRSFLTGVGVVETACKHSPLKDKIFLDGLREVCAKDDVLLDALSIYEITHNVTAGSPMLMVLYTAFSCCAKTHALNSFLRHRTKNATPAETECSPTHSSETTPPPSSEGTSAPAEPTS